MDNLAKYNLGAVMEDILQQMFSPIVEKLDSLSEKLVVDSPPKVYIKPTKSPSDKSKKSTVNYTNTSTTSQLDKYRNKYGKDTIAPTPKIAPKTTTDKPIKTKAKKAKTTIKALLKSGKTRNIPNTLKEELLEELQEKLNNILEN